jgi:hypothetical protein
MAQQDLLPALELFNLEYCGDCQTLHTAVKLETLFNRTVDLNSFNSFALAEDTAIFTPELLELILSHARPPHHIADRQNVAGLHVPSSAVHLPAYGPLLHDILLLHPLL